MSSHRDEGSCELKDRLVVLGRILGAFGVAGWVKVESYTDPPGALLKYKRWLLSAPEDGRTVGLASEPVAVEVSEGRVVQAGVQVRLESLTSREQAAKLRGTAICVRRSELPALDGSEYYWIDLIGLEAWSLAGEYLGEIADIRALPGHPVLRLVEKRATGGKPIERWVPLVSERIRRVDLDNRRAVLDWRADW